MMRLLHTADWHLGARLADLPRLDEHAWFLDWLVELVRDQEVDALVVAGDIFDSGSPPAEARALFFRFAARLAQETRCRSYLLAGNHDAPAMLQAPAPVLAALGMTIIGDTLPPERSGFPLRCRDGLIRGWLGAVPFLRPSDLPAPPPGADLEARRAQLVEAVADRYTAVAEALEDARSPGQFLVGTGHLFAQGGTLSDSERMIQVGHRLGLPVEVFPPSFDYVALGHLHRPQRLPGAVEVRYSGAPLPMSFAETHHPQEVVLLTFGDDGLREVAPLEVPRARRLLQFTGTTTTLRRMVTGASDGAGQLGLFGAGPRPTLPAGDDGLLKPGWASLVLEDDDEDDVSALLASIGYRVVATARPRPTMTGQIVLDLEPVALSALEPLAVFRQLCEEKLGGPPSEPLEHAFLDVLQAVGTDQEDA
jgi:exonuclease SbcD